MKPIASIVIPAHNESAVIGRTLQTLLATAKPNEFEIVIVCNGCIDDTAQIARQFAPEANVMELDASSKIAALNLGDKVAVTFPRIYLDADIQLETQSARVLVQALSGTAIMAAAPEPFIDTAKCTPIVRAFYRTWLRSPFALSGHIGTGLYGVSKGGRDRFDQFPELVADDLFVYSLFDRSERAALSESCFRIDPPRDVVSLFKVRTRVYYGNAQFAADDAWGDRSPSNSAASAKYLVTSARTARQAIDTAIYLVVNTAAKVYALCQMRTKRTYTWARDDSSRRAESVS